MVIVVDSGSTKTEWKLLDKVSAGESYFTAGINPYFLSSDAIFGLLTTELHALAAVRPEKIYFYGTGCNSEAKNQSVKDALQRFFNPGEIFVGSDLLGAARSLCGNEPGIACIIGTGSNSCYYDGSEIVSNVAPLGYILGDEGGGAVLGRKLVAAVLKKQVPDKVIKCFFDTYNLTRAEILENVYMKPFPNRFLGQFAKFISANIEVPELQEIITDSFDEFIKRNVIQYPEARTLSVNFTGSIAYHFRKYLEVLLIQNSLKTGIITLSPMENLVKYHLELINLRYEERRKG
jgi:N-acetylglucosamine kinase-like BadF-type ATPase